jgi:hypothetical protein
MRCWHVTGASGTPGDEAPSVLSGRNIVLWPDADDPGRKHMRRVAEGLQGVAKGVQVYEWKDAPEGGDAADNPAVLVRTKSGIRALFAEMVDTSVLQADSTLLTPNSFSNVAGSEPSSTLTLGLGLAVRRFRDLPKFSGPRPYVVQAR